VKVFKDNSDEAPRGFLTQLLRGQNKNKCHEKAIIFVFNSEG
jgi:hypothetical protein